MVHVTSKAISSTAGSLNKHKMEWITDFFFSFSFNSKQALIYKAFFTADLNVTIATRKAYQRQVLTIFVIFHLIRWRKGQS